MPKISVNQQDIFNGYLLSKVLKIMQQIISDELRQILVGRLHLQQGIDTLNSKGR